MEKDEDINHKNEDGVEIQDPLEELFDKRDRVNPVELKDKDPKTEEKKESVHLKKERPKIEEQKSDSDDEKKTDSTKEKDEFVKLNERLAENQKFARKHVQKVKNATKVVHNLIEEGSLTEEEAKGLLETLQSDEELEEPYINSNSMFSPFANIFKIAKKEFENIQRYTEDETLQEKLTAFEYLLALSEPDEIEDIYEELNDLVNHPVKLAKKIITIGQDAHESFFKDLKKNGGLKNIIKEKNKSVEQLQKKIDKLEKKLLQYEDYDKPNYKIDDFGGSHDSNNSDLEFYDPIDAMIEARDKVRRR